MPKTDLQLLQQLNDLLSHHPQPGLVAEVESALVQTMDQIAANTVTVSSAVELTPTEKTQTETAINQLFPHASRIEFVINPHLLGGLKISTPNQTHDYSLLHQLTALSSSLI